MSGYEVDRAELRTTAEAVRSVADDARALHPGADLAVGAAGIPGAAAGPLMDRVGQGWQRALADWTSQVHGYAAGLDASAATYTTSEVTATTDFSHLANAL